MKSPEMENILKAYTDGKMTADEANEKLKALGANFHIDPERNPEGKWTEAEMAAGFIPADEVKPVQKKLDVSRREDLAGRDDVIQTVCGRKYVCEYDELGYIGKVIPLKKK